MSQLVTQSVQTELICILTAVDGVTPVTGVVFGSVTCEYRKAGAASFTAKTVTAPNFRELGNGFYGITFTAGELDTLGVFAWVVNGAGFAQSANTADIVSAASATTLPPSIQTCILTGHILDALGDPVVGAAVSARLIGMPTILGTYGLSEDYISVKTNNNGEFFLEIARLAQVDVTISVMNYRRTLTVPNAATAVLFTQVP